VENAPDMRLVEALVKMIWGTDERCERERAATDRMLADAEQKVETLQHVLDERAPRNLDETLYELTHRPRE
jgi:hypothetical protein